jgi:protein arginine kinase activator
MICDHCKLRPATVHFTKIVAGQKTDYYLCEQCAQEHGDFFAKAAQAFHFNDLLSSLLNMESSPGFTSLPMSNARCNVCGMTYNQFTQIGRFGCPNCYESFASRLEPLLKRIQSNTAHVGKVPQKSGEATRSRNELQQLRKELQTAVTTEQYEQAAKIRDKIRELEQKLEG